MKQEIEFDANELAAAEHWHGGQTSMLYAITSVGALRCGTCRPYETTDDGIRMPLTDDEWFRDLVGRLEHEASEAIESAQRQCNETDDPGVIEEYWDDIEGLENIVIKCTQALA